MKYIFNKRSDELKQNCSACMSTDMYTEKFKSLCLATKVILRLDSVLRKGNSVLVLTAITRCFHSLLLID